MNTHKMLYDDEFDDRESPPPVAAFQVYIDWYSAQSWFCNFSMDSRKFNEFRMRKVIVKRYDDEGLIVDGKTE